MLVLKLAWRNIWRNPRRSVVVVLAVGIGLFSVIGAISYSDGLLRQMLDATIGLEGGHIQVARSGYVENPTIRMHVGAELIEPVRGALADAGLDSAIVAPFVRSAGMIQSPAQASGVMIHGVELPLEARLSTLSSYVKDGTYLSGSAGEILLGRDLGQRLDARVGEKLVLLVNDLSGEVAGGAYRVVGFYETSSQAFDQANVYVSLAEAQRLLAYENRLSGINVRLADPDVLEQAAAVLRAAIPSDAEVITWRERNRAMVLMMEMFDLSIIIMVVILFTAVAFTLVNTYLMVILERVREFGVMMANGVHPRSIRRMLYAEALFTMLLGFAVGGAMAAVFLLYYGSTGIDLSTFEEGLRTYGMASRVYPALDTGHLLTALGTITVMVSAAVTYPAWRASRYSVVNALNHV